MGPPIVFRVVPARYMRLGHLAGVVLKPRRKRGFTFRNVKRQVSRAIFGRKAPHEILRALFTRHFFSPMRRPVSSPCSPPPSPARLKIERPDVLFGLPTLGGSRRVYEIELDGKMRAAKVNSVRLLFSPIPVYHHQHSAVFEAKSRSATSINVSSQEPPRQNDGGGEVGCALLTCRSKKIPNHH